MTSKEAKNIRATQKLIKEVLANWLPWGDRRILSAVQDAMLGYPKNLKAYKKSFPHRLPPPNVSRQARGVQLDSGQAAPNPMRVSEPGQRFPVGARRARNSQFRKGD